MVNDQRPIGKLNGASASVGCGLAYPELSDRKMRGATGLDFLRTGVEKGLDAPLAKTARTFASL